MAKEKTKQPAKPTESAEPAKPVDPAVQFRIDRVKKLQNLYSDQSSTKRRYNGNDSAMNLGGLKSAAAVRDLLQKAFTDRSKVVELSQKLYAINPIYSHVIDYMANMFMWRYKVTPHRVYSKSKAKSRKKLGEEDYNQIYNLMLEVADGLSIETKFPALLTLLLVNGGVYFTTICDEDSLTVDTLLLPDKYCRKIGQTQYGTAIIEFDFSYFQDLGLTQEQLNDYLKSFPKAFKSGYAKYSRDATKRWQQLDPHFSSGLLLNDYSIPTYFYIFGSILDFEKYQDNELERNENLLKYIVVQKMPIYQDKLIFEMDEVEALHSSLRRVIDRGDKTRLITTFGDVNLLKVAENDTSENQVLSKAFTAIFNNAGFNSAIFTSDSVEALKMSLIRDKGIVWHFVQSLQSFYNMAINNWFDFKNYQADIDILPISPYTYDDDIQVYKNNATLGIGKLDFIIASGTKQRHINDIFELESYLHLDRIQPLQTSYTQTAEDRKSDEKAGSNTAEPQDSDSGIEPSEEGPSDSADSEQSR